MFNYKYQESQIISEVVDYIQSTYQEHYQSYSVQLIDLFDSEGIVVEYLKTSIMRYVMRFGKKEGNNIKDLYKAIHCIVLLIFFATDRNNKDHTPVLLTEKNSEDIKRYFKDT
jgi:hypothetical protein